MSRRQLTDTEDLILVWMQEFGTAKGDHENHILKTIGVGPCIAVTLYDKESRVGTMAHLSVGTHLQGAFQGMVASMRSAGYQDEDRGKVEVRILGGWKGYSEELLEGIHRRLSFHGFSNIIEVDPNELNGHKCVALDTQTGELFDLANFIPMSLDSEEERLIDRMREAQAQIPYLHYTYDERARAYAQKPVLLESELWDRPVLMELQNTPPRERGGVSV